MLRSSSIPALTACAVVLLAAVAQGQPATAGGLPSALSGTWRYPHEVSHGVGLAMAAFEPRIRALPGFVQESVRARISGRMRVARAIVIDLEGDRVRVTSRGEEETTIATRLGGTSRVRHADGDTRSVTQRLRGGGLEQHIEGDNGVTRRLFSTSPDGATMHVDMTVENERLGAPVRWRLDYVR